MVNDKVMRLIVQEVMKGSMLLEDGETEASVIDDYFNHPKHKNYIIDDAINGFLCVTEYDDYAIVNFAWHMGSFATLKKMVRLGKAIYKIYTIDKGIPLYYSGKKNLYANHSEEIAENVWQFIP